jgi:hypothetical protein
MSGLSWPVALVDGQGGEVVKVFLMVVAIFT